MKKEKTKSSLGRVLPLVLCLCLVLSMLPGMGTRVFAAGAGKAVGKWTTALSINVNTSGAQGGILRRQAVLCDWVRCKRRADSRQQRYHRHLACKKQF